MMYRRKKEFGKLPWIPERAKVILKLMREGHILRLEVQPRGMKIYFVEGYGIMKPKGCEWLIEHEFIEPRFIGIDGVPLDFKLVAGI